MLIKLKQQTKSKSKLRTLLGSKSCF